MIKYFKTAWAYLLVVTLLGGCHAIEDLLEQNNDSEPDTKEKNAAEDDSEEQESLPEDLNLSFTEPELELESVHEEALIEKLRTTYSNSVDGSLYTVDEEEDIYTTVYVKTRPLKDIMFDLPDENEESDDEMLELLRDSVDNQFDEQLTVVVEVRTYDVNALSLKDDEAFELILESADEEVNPVQIRAGRIKHQVQADVLWYKREFRVDFPRAYEGTDLWESSEISFTIRPLREEFTASDGEYYYFNLSSGDS